MNKDLPVVAIVGRPNVGKSTLFNKLAGKRLSIVKDEIGVTRDRLYTEAEWCGYNFLMIDTGGINLRSSDDMYKQMKLQAELAIEVADVTIFMTDGKAGVTVDDGDIAKFLKRAGKKVVLAVNKIDNIALQANAYDFFSLGLGEPNMISSEQMLGLGDLLDSVVKHFDKMDLTPKDTVKIAVVGKPNAGKSSIVNKLLGYDRVIVSDVAGTTRDAVDTPFEHHGKNYLLIDTAGIRRQRSVEADTVESYGVMRALVAIKRADIVLVVIDASKTPTEQDTKIAGLVHEEHKPNIIVLNKWDTIAKDTHTQGTYKEVLDEQLAFMPYFVTEFVSAKTGQRIEKLLHGVDTVMQNANRRVQTSTLNDIVGKAVTLNPPTAPRGQKIKIKYATQFDTNPPRFAVFCNDSTLVHNNYKRYLENSLRKAFDFAGSPLVLEFNNKKGDE
ncbi:MAG: ribosome biogenesis GTPase Der [Firmicutes bacterium]|nr:ribosome biogenesis GTPase Der [Bacillota bacterium]